WADLLAAAPLPFGRLRAAWDLVSNGLRLRLEQARSPHLPKPPKVGLGTRWERSLREVRFALRRLAHQPAFSLTAVAIVGLGIGANTTIFSIVNAALWKPLPYERPDELVRIYLTEPERGLPDGVSYAEVEDLRRQSDVFDEVAFHADTNFFTVDLNGLHTTVLGEAYSASFFRLLGMQPALGRGFLPEDDAFGAAPVAMISHPTWKRRFGGDPQILGRQLRVNGVPLTVVGVGPKGYQGTTVGIESEIYLPWGTAVQVDRVSKAQLEDRSSRELFALARLRPGVDREAAQSALTVLAANLEADHPATNEDRTFQVFAASDIRSHPLLDRAMLPVSAFFMVLVGLVLMVSISNLANLLLAKASGRKKEMALRLALGAQRRQLVGQLLTESTLLSVAGGLVGVGVALVLPRWLLAAQLPIPLQLSFDSRLDGRVLLFALLLSLATGLLFGIAPALAATRGAFSQAMRGERGFRFGRRRRLGLRDALIALQVTVSTLLLAAGALFLHALLQGQGADPGFVAEKAVLANLDAQASGLGDEEAIRR
ncbi:MAG: ABC transporter permease, partial [Acidobacteria bacterium]|nr:ABC transporter permease [Acidobacteriota bacterium]